MFESLDEQLKLDEKKSVSTGERVMRWILMILIAAVVFGAIYWGAHMMQG